MKKITAKDLVKDQYKRYLQLKQREQDSSVTEDAKARFRRLPYMGIYSRQNSYKNNLGGVDNDQGYMV